MYNLIIYIYLLGVAVASLFSKKVRKMWRGERRAFDVLRSKVEPEARYVWFHAASLGEFEQGRPLMERITEVVAMMKDRVDFVKELWPLCSFFFIAPTEYDEKTRKKRWKDYSARQMTELAEVLEGIDDFSIEGQEPVVKQWVESKDYKLGDIMNAFRLALVGIGKGPGMFDITAFLGKEETLRRLHTAIEVLK